MGVGVLDIRHYGDGIVAFDACYERPLQAAIHMIVETGCVVLVDTGSNASFPAVVEALSRQGLDLAAVEYIVLTHIHLDHAGGAGRLMQHCPNARLVVHPRGARHMIDPAALIAGVTAVYGADYVARVYGEIIPVPAGRIVEAADGARLWLGSRELEVIDAPGHARHHLCLVDVRTRSVFTGDVCGVSYRALDVSDRAFVFPSTTPSQFDPVAMVATVDRVLALAPSALYLTHYGQLSDPALQMAALKRRLERFVAIAKTYARHGTARLEHIRLGMTQYLLRELKTHGVTLTDEEMLEVLAMDMDLNAQGLCHWLDHG